ncbi:MAG: hypothetical protein JNJ89_17615 [Rubrivivax sp.]|nr:hypothetical protein [Rubrivivax sp.]
MSLRADQSQALVALAALGALLLSYPLLALFNRAGTVFGVPLLYAWLFGAWALLIVLLALATRPPPASADEPAPAPPVPR